MLIANTVLLALALGVSLWLARGSSRAGQALLILSVLLISALLFLPSSFLRASVGMGAVDWMQAVASRLSWKISEVAHFLVFTWLGLLIPLLRRDLRGWRGLTVLLVLAVAAELAQLLTPTREARLGDVATNLLGAGAGWAMAQAALYLRRRKSVDGPR